ncbi:MAG: ribonuclease P protein component [Candidatus Kaiserbacteria bacterium]|nr:MAG: ribonuclease P protein component [Candidatus Kaiserbacteria bacterium]
MRRKDFLALKGARGRRAHGRYFSVLSSSLSGETRYACVVSKKIAARAVDRNRVRRIWREALRAHQKSPPAGLALVFHAKKEAIGTSLTEISRDIAALIERVS